MSVLRMPWKLLILLALVVAALIIILNLTGPRGEEVKISELNVAWPELKELPGRWCGSGTRSASAEAVLISCDERCHALLRYWMFAPMDVELEMNLSLEIWKDGKKIGERTIVARKETTGLYIQTPVILLTIPKGAEVRISKSSIRIPDCAGNEWRPPQIIYIRGALDGWKQVSKGLEVVRLSDGLFAVRWRGRAKLVCGSIAMDLREIHPEKGELALISVGKGCEVEVEGRRVTLKG